MCLFNNCCCNVYNSCRCVCRPRCDVICNCWRVWYCPGWAVPYGSGLGYVTNPLLREPLPTPTPTPTPVQSMAVVTNNEYQIINGGGFMLPSTLTYKTGNDIIYDSTNQRLQVLTAGNYQVTYSFDYVAGNSGSFAVEIQNFPATRHVETVTSLAEKNISNTTTLALPANTYVNLRLVPIGEFGTIDALQIRNLNITVKKIY